MADITLRNLHFTRRGPAGTIAVLNGVTHTFMSGTVTIVHGPSGSGKTTALMAASGMLRPTSGEVLVGASTLYTMDDAERTAFRLRQVGFVFQQFNLHASLTAVENVACTLSLQGVRWAEALKRASTELAKVGMEARQHSYPAVLSGGEQQRTAVARATVKRPTLLVADEPTAALDWASGSAVMRLLRNAAKQDGSTVIVVTHDPRTEAFADNGIEMRDGQFV